VALPLLALSAAPLCAGHYSEFVGQVAFQANASRHAACAEWWTDRLPITSICPAKENTTLPRDRSSVDESSQGHGGTGSGFVGWLWSLVRGPASDCGDEGSQRVQKKQIRKWKQRIEELEREVQALRMLTQVQDARTTVIEPTDIALKPCPQLVLRCFQEENGPWHLDDADLPLNSSSPPKRDDSQRQNWVNPIDPGEVLLAFPSSAGVSTIKQLMGRQTRDFLKLTRSLYPHKVVRSIEGPAELIGSPGLEMYETIDESADSVVPVIESHGLWTNFDTMFKSNSEPVAAPDSIKDHGLSVFSYFGSFR
jgi:hypothetical protein